MITERDPQTNWQQRVRVLRTPRVHEQFHSTLFHIIVPFPIPLEVGADHHGIDLGHVPANVLVCHT